MTARRRKKPAYLLHKPTGQARVRINGKDVYLGAFQSPESLDRYEEVVRQWLLANCPANESGITLTIDERAILYLDYAEQYYRHRDGRQTSEMAAVRSALRYLGLGGFDEQLSDEEAQALLTKMRAENSGILNWAMQGLRPPELRSDNHSSKACLAQWELGCSIPRKLIRVHIGAHREFHVQLVAFD